jgi:ElaB/YqjD/DUF883 family membrane-anchored ribosome-binding protein
MAGGIERSDVAGSVTDGELDGLLRAEERLQAALAESEAEAATIRAQAERALESARSEFERALEEARTVLEGRVSADRDAEIALVRRKHEAEKAALESITSGQVERLAAAVIERLFASEPGEAGPAEPSP